MDPRYFRKRLCSCFRSCVPLAETAIELSWSLTFLFKCEPDFLQSLATKQEMKKSNLDSTGNCCGAEGNIYFFACSQQPLNFDIWKGNICHRRSSIKTVSSVFFSGTVLLLFRCPHLHFETVDISFDPLHPKKGEGIWIMQY